MSKKDKTTPTAKSGGRRFRNDFIFIVALLLVVSALGLGFYLFRGEGNTVIVIEHNLDVIKSADYIIDLGPEGGNAGGKIIAKGTPEEVAKVKKSYTGQFLKKVLGD